MRKISLLIGVFTFALVLSACNQTPEPAVMEAPSAAAGDTVEVGEPGGGIAETGEAMMADTGEVRKITLDSFKFGYSEEMIIAKPGETIELTLTNSDGFHDLVIDELDVATKQFDAGESDTVTFTIPADAAGKTYEYYCSVGNHRAMGMVGKLVIEE